MVGYSPWGHKESDTAVRLHFTSLHFIGERGQKGDLDAFESKPEETSSPQTAWPISLGEHQGLEPEGWLRMKSGFVLCTRLPREPLAKEWGGVQSEVDQVLGLAGVPHSSAAK